MLLFIDLPAAHARLDAGELACPSPECAGRLGPWGSARARTIRLGPDRHERVTPRRARCRVCERTHVLGSGATYPRRPDSAVTVGTALLAASSGLGHRRVAELVGLPHTTVRGWLRRATINADRAWSHAVRWVNQFEFHDTPYRFRGGGIAATLDGAGHAVAAWVRRFGPVNEPWHAAVVLTGGLLLATLRTRPALHPLDHL